MQPTDALASVFFSRAMARELTRQELHNLAMNIVGRELEAQGYEFLGVNSTLGKNPQFVCIREKAMSFIVVRPVGFPDDPTVYDLQKMKKIKEHAQKHNARCFYAGVGLYHAVDQELPVELDQEYLVEYEGLIEI